MRSDPRGCISHFFSCVLRDRQVLVGEGWQEVGGQHVRCAQTVSQTSSRMFCLPLKAVCSVRSPSFAFS